MAPPEPSNSYEHLQLQRAEPVTERHRRQDRRPRHKPVDPRQFGAHLAERLDAAKMQFSEDVGGFDERRLLKLVVRSDEPLPDFDQLPGIEVVSQEDRAVVLAFATADGMAEVESRLASLVRDGTVTRKELLYAIEDFRRWTPDDRKGNALRQFGFPTSEPFILDVELWPQERRDRRDQMIQSFRQWLSEMQIEYLDGFSQPSLVMAKIRCTRAQAERQLLHHRDVRAVDLPPRFGFEVGLLQTDIQKIEPPREPAPGVPVVAVLDSGITAAHPLLGPAVGEVAGFVPPDRATVDQVPLGHGTFVGGLALYGDVHECLRSGRFVPALRLLAGKVFKDDGTDDTLFVEKCVEDAVRYFTGEYNCRVFNLSYGDLNKIYDGRRLRGLAYTLDRLSRELGVLFVTAAGNRMLSALPENWWKKYPGYLFEPEGRILDPGTAINAITVGGVARYELSRDAQRYPECLEDVVIARCDQPSPITRCGPSVGGAIKPDFVEFAGSVSLDRNGRPRTTGLGVVSLNSGHAMGRPFAEQLGTSFAAPLIAHKAARLVGENPGATPNLLRALLGAHARWPQDCVQLLDPQGNSDGRERLRRAVGYGRVDDEALYRSSDRTVTLISEEVISADRHHFFEIPLPHTWWSGARRKRSVSVALAYTPEVRTTRLDYRATKLRYALVCADDLNQVAASFRRNRDEGMPERAANRWIAGDKRNSGTLQVSRWEFGGPLAQNRLFVVVTRQDAVWSNTVDEPERYALCVVLDDRERVDVKLHSEVRAVLQVRERARAQV